MGASRSVVHIIGPSRGGIRRHVRYVAAHPPAGYATTAIIGPPAGAGYFGSLPYRVAGPMDVLRSPRADVIHAHGFGPGLIALHPRRPPVVLTVHIDLMTQGRTAGSGAFRALARLVGRRSDAVTAVSEQAARHFPGAHIIEPATDPLSAPRRSRQEVRDELGTSADRVVVVSVARLHADKGLDAFIAAVSGTEAEGWICGDGPLRDELQRLATSTSVRLLGHRDDVADLLGAADVFALPSVGEAYGIAVAEAIAAGLPVIVTASGAMPEIAGDAGLVVAAGDRHAFAAAVQRLVDDEALRVELGERARRIGFPDPAEVVRRLGEVYDKVCR